MPPAFSSTKQAGAFALLLLILLLLPALTGKSWLPPREQIYSSIWWGAGNYPYLDQQFFQEKDDIDIAFVGSSRIWVGIDTPYVQGKLSEKLGRPAVVRSFCWNGAGYDALYFITQDLLEHRKVRTLVFYDVYGELDIPNLQAPHLFRFGDDAEVLAGLPMPVQASYYFAAILGMPRNLLGLTRFNLPADLFSSKKNFWEINHHAANPAARLGALTSQLGFGINFPADNAPFIDFTPHTDVQPSDVCIYSPETKAKFQFQGPPISSWQLHFARKFAALAQEHGCKLVLLHLPVMAEMRSPVIQEREFWPDALCTDVTMIGIPCATLFAGITDEDIHKLYADPDHLNKNGQEYFTPIITPALLQIYDSKTK